jgi:hypothetical protein
MNFWCYNRGTNALRGFCRHPGYSDWMLKRCCPSSLSIKAKWDPIERVLAPHVQLRNSHFDCCCLLAFDARYVNRCRRVVVRRVISNRGIAVHRPGNQARNGAQVRGRLGWLPARRDAAWRRRVDLEPRSTQPSRRAYHTQYPRSAARQGRTCTVFSGVLAGFGQPLLGGHGRVPSICCPDGALTLSRTCHGRRPEFAPNGLHVASRCWTKKQSVAHLAATVKLPGNSAARELTSKSVARLCGHPTLWQRQLCRLQGHPLHHLSSPLHLIAIGMLASDCGSIHLHRAEH